MTLAADAVSTLVIAPRDFTLAAFLSHARFIATFVVLVVLGGVIGFEAPRRARYGGVAVAGLGALAASLAYGAGVASQHALGVTGSVLAILVVSAVVVIVAGQLARRPDSP
jgi:hypothetical protein